MFGYVNKRSQLIFTGYALDLDRDLDEEIAKTIKFN